MFRNNLTLIFRSFKRYRGTFCINLTGLATGLTAAFFIYLWVNDELLVDSFHEKDSQLFQIMTNVSTPSGILTIENTPARLAETLAREIPEIEYAASASNSYWSSNKTLISNNDTRIATDGQFISQPYFDIFSFDFTAGNGKTALSDKYNVIISEDLAMKLFQTADNAIGKTVSCNHEMLQGNFVVAAIFKQLPASSSIQADIFFHYDLFLEQNPKLEDWRNSDPSTFVVLKPNTDLDDFNHKIANFLKSKNQQSTATIFAQRYSEKYLYNNYEHGKPVGGRISYVKLFSIIALFILINACINFMNLSTAKAMRRVKEIGVRKIMGAKRKVLVLQFLLESMIMTVLSFIVAIILIMLLLPLFNDITAKQLTLDLNIRLITGALILVLFTGILSGIYPAFYLSDFNPTAALKGIQRPHSTERWTRKGLVLFQSTISVVLIIATLVVYKQIELVQTKHLGYNRDNIIYFEKSPGEATEGLLFEKNLESFLLEIKTLPGVVNATNFRHSITNRQGGTTDVTWEGKDPNSMITFTDLAVGYDFIETLGIEMLEGRAFSRDFTSDKQAVVLNQKAIEVMGLSDPIGKVIRIWGEDLHIIGVTTNFHFQSFYEEIKPLFFDLSLNKRVSKIMVRIEPGSERETIERLRSLYAKYNPGLAFEYSFLDDDYQKLYDSENRIAILSQYFAVIAVIISSLGLLGLAAFTTERRKKEIGIRKVLGSSVWRVAQLLSLEFLQTIMLSVLIAFPVGYLLVKNWLDSFAYRIELQWWYFLGTGVLVLTITMLTVGLQAIKAALTNPTQSLRNE